MYGTMMVTQTSVTRGEEGEREGKEERLAHMRPTEAHGITISTAVQVTLPEYPTTAVMQ